MQEDLAITANSPDIVQQRGNILVLEWTLSRRPDPEWAQFVTYSGAQKSGSLTFVNSDPKVVGNKLRLIVEDRDIEAAVRYVEQSIPLANQKFESQVMTRRRREAEQRQKQDAAAAARLTEARERLRRATGSTNKEE